MTIEPSNTIGTNYLSLGTHLDGASTDNTISKSLASNAGIKLVRMQDWKIPNYREKPCTYWNEATKTGTWDWTNVDAVVQSIFNAGAEPFITLGFARGASSIRSYIPNGMALNPNTELPYPDSWAAYARAWVKHFENKGMDVRYYETMNEPWAYFGWFDAHKIDNFMAVFNAAAQAMRAENSNVKVSFDSTNRKPVLNYWLSNGGADLDYIAFHKYDAGSIGEFSDQVMLNRAESYQMTTSSSYYGIRESKQVYYNARGKWIPAINSESNFNSAYEPATDPRTQKMLGSVWLALVLRTGIIEGLNYNVYYTYSSSASWHKINKPNGGPGFGMINSDDNEPWYPYLVHQMLNQNLDYGDELVKSTSSSQDIRSLSWMNGDKLNILLICKKTQEYTVTIKGVNKDFSYQKIDETIPWTNPSIQTGLVTSNQGFNLNGYTVMLLQETGQSPPSLPFSDDFETNDFGKWSGTYTTSGETATTHTYAPYKGTYHGRYNSNGDTGVEYAYSYKSINEAEVYARGYFKLIRGLPLVDNDDRFYFLRFRSGDTSLAGAGIKRNNGVNKWIIYGRDGSTNTGSIYSTSPVIEMDRYYCVELHWKKHSTGGLVELYVDGIKILQTTGLNTANYGNADEINFGLIYAANVQNELLVYGDTFEASTTYIGPDSSNHVIHASAGSGGSINPSGDIVVAEGADRTFTIAPYSGYHTSQLLVDGGSVGTPSSYTFYDVDRDHTIVAQFEEDAPNQYSLSVNTVGSGSVNKSPNRASYEDGTVVTLTAVPASGWEFSGWSGDLSGTSNPASTAMTRDKSVTATFTETQTGLPFKDDLESGDFSQWSSVTTSYGETATTSSNLPYKGLLHGRFESDGNGNWDQAYLSKSINEDEIYARGYFTIRNGLPLIDNNDRFYFIRFASGEESLAAAGIRVESGVMKWTTYSRDTSGRWIVTYANSPTIEANRYYCIELHWRKHSSSGLVELFIDGQKRAEVTGVDTTYYGNVDSISFGLVNSINVQNELLVYGDTFEASTTYIGHRARSSFHNIVRPSPCSRNVSPML